jgi:hypothetical protein
MYKMYTCTQLCIVNLLLWKGLSLKNLPAIGIEPIRIIHPSDFESDVSTNFTTPADARVMLSNPFGKCNRE